LAAKENRLVQKEYSLSDIVEVEWKGIVEQWLVGPALATPNDWWEVHHVLFCVRVARAKDIVVLLDGVGGRCMLAYTP
jgi:hypothetical protein